jgi:hypothetical protein
MIKASKTPKNKRIRVLAICSSGGHWVQLRRLTPAFSECFVIYACPLTRRPEGIEGDFVSIPDANRWHKRRFLWMAICVCWLVLRTRPTHILSTGAAPGYVAIRFGKLLGSKALWIDSIANAEELSLSGRKAGKTTDLWLTQWKHLERPEGPRFRGSVL